MFLKTVLDKLSKRERIVIITVELDDYSMEAISTLEKIMKIDTFNHQIKEYESQRFLVAARIASQTLIIKVAELERQSSQIWHVFYANGRAIFGDVRP